MSSTRSALLPFYVLDVTALAANQTSLITNVSSSDVVQYDIEWANGSSFDATIEVDVLSSFEDTTVESAWKWNTLSFGGSTPTMTGASGSHNIILTANPFAKIRARVVHNAGTADVKISIKGNGN
jgi:hypothetical protein